MNHTYGNFHDHAATHVPCIWGSSINARHGHGSRMRPAVRTSDASSTTQHGPAPRPWRTTTSRYRRGDEPPRRIMYLHTQQFINEIAVDEPDPAAANALQEGLGGQFGEMRTMMQYLFQSMNFRGDRDLQALQGSDSGSRHRRDQPCGTDRHHHLAPPGRIAGVQRQEDRPSRPARRQGCDAADDRLGYQQHSPLPGGGAGRSTGRCGRKPLERVLRLQQRKPGARPAVQPHVGVDRTAAEVPDLRDDGQQDGAFDDRLPDRARSGARERVRQGVGESWE